MFESSWALKQNVSVCAVLLALALGVPVLTAAAGKAGTSPVLKTKWGDLKIFPADNPWNQDISKLPVHPNSKAFIGSIGMEKGLFPDFGTQWQGVPNGIPFVVVPKGQKKVPVRFQYADESDSGPYPIPDDAPIEGGPKSKGDRHIIVVDVQNRKLYEMYNGFKEGRGWKGDSGAIWDLTSNRGRPAGWTSADAAGLPIFPGLVRYDEAVEQGEIRHALRFTVRKTQQAYIPPATHFASRHRDPHLPPMGLRVRLKANFDDRKFPKTIRVILKAMKIYGMIVADHGSDWYISGAPHPKWNDAELKWLKKVQGKDFEAVQTGKIVKK